MPQLLRRRMLCTCLLLPAMLWLPLPSAHAQEAATAELGKRIFTAEAEPPCALCHTLGAAEAAGEVGPSLDELKPTEEQVIAAVSKGVGIMPAYQSLSEEQIAAVAHYVAKVAGAAK